jgi:hypothetical protein
MNGGVLHAVEALKSAELDAAIAGYELFGFEHAASALLRARSVGNSDKAMAEARLNREYAAAVADDASLEAAMDRFDPPVGSTLKVEGESDEVLIEAYRSAARLHGRATAVGDSQSANHAHKTIALAYRTLRTRGPGGQAKLLPLIRDPDVGVRTWVSAHALEFAPAAGEPALVELAAEPGLVGFGAKMTLKEWRAGRLSFP